MRRDGTGAYDCAPAVKVIQARDQLDLSILFLNNNLMLVRAQ